MCHMVKLANEADIIESERLFRVDVFVVKLGLGSSAFMILFRMLTVAVGAIGFVRFGQRRTAKLLHLLKSTRTAEARFSS